MADVYATIKEVDPAIQERLAGILELRAADPQQRAMLNPISPRSTSRERRGRSKSVAGQDPSPVCWPAGQA